MEAKIAPSEGLEGRLEELAKNYGKFREPIILGMAGFALIGAAFFWLLFTRRPEPEIQIIPSQSEASLREAVIFVDLQGAVEKPGVYELPGGDRLNDLLIRAGGLSAEADREWAGKNLNLAAKLTDGQKIYIPKRGDLISKTGVLGGGISTGVVSGQAVININTASASELDSLPGIGEVRAQAIIQNRPYSSIEELLTKKVIPKSVYEKIKEKIVAW